MIIVLAHTASASWLGLRIAALVYAFLDEMMNVLCGRLQPHEAVVFISVMHAFLGRCRTIILVVSWGNISQPPSVRAGWQHVD